MTVLDAATMALIAAGLLFFIAGTVGLIRFPDPLARLHAIAKADNFGLSLIALGLAFQADGWAIVLELFLVWVLALMSAVVAAHLIFHTALQMRGEDDREEETVE